MKRLGWGVLGAALIWSASGCDDDATKPLAGAGIRFVFSGGADTLEGLRVALLDSDQMYQLGDCGQPSRTVRVSTIPQTLGPCETVELRITNLIGEEVKTLVCPVPPETTCNVNDLFWDGTDAEGNPVPGGCYFFNLRCFQADSVREVGLKKYVAAGPEEICDWPLWSEEVASVPFWKTIDFSPFPVQIDLGMSGADTTNMDVIRFRNPYLVRVHASGMHDFEQQVTLKEGKWTEVNVMFVPLSDTLGVSIQ
jgi:hypothetical protein